MLNDYLQQLHLQRHRGLLVLSGRRDRVHSLAAQYLQSWHNANVLWLGDTLPATHSPVPHIRHARARDVTSYLGSDCNVLVFDAHSGFSPNAFCAAADTVLGGGIILLLLPDLADWSSTVDADFSVAYAVQKPPRRFLQRVHAHILAVANQSSFLKILTEDMADDSWLAVNDFLPVAYAVTENSEQQQLIGNILRTINGRAHRPLLIRAARGRGKSAALGMALASWLGENHTGRIIVTGPSRSAVATAFSWAEKQPYVSMNHDLLRNSNSSASASVEFIAVDQIVSCLPSADVIVVDEAAAIPLPILQQLLQYYARSIFITTTIGYEGAGRGFALRFTRMLDDYSAQWRRASLTEPMRWAADDPLERWMQQCFLLADDSVVDNSTSAITDAEKITRRLVSRDELAGNEDLLAAIFRLLVDAHYRTEPDDLRYLLDAPDINIFISLCGDRVVAAALIADEKPLSIEVIERIKTDKHRPRGHLLAQTLGLQDGMYAALPLHAWRIVRIAVQSELQSRGIGTQLLAAIVQAAHQTGIDYLASSFALDPAVFGFWLKAGFSPWRIGLHRDHATASYAALLAIPFTDSAKAMQSQLQQRFAQQLPQLLPQYWRDLEPKLIIRLYQQLPCVVTPSAIDLQQVNDYLRGAISYDAAWLSLSALLQSQLSLVSSQHETQATMELSVRRILQCWSWDELVKTGKYSGRKNIEVELRDSLAKIFSSQ